MAVKLSTIFEYSLLAIPLYIFAISPILRTVFPPLSASDASTYHSFEKTDALVLPNDDLTCPPHAYSIHIAHRDPLVVYIEHFLSDPEADHLVQLAEQNYVKSTVFTGEEEAFDPTIRNSTKALLPRDGTVQCIEQRAREIQGWRKDVYIERLWAQRYEAGGHYTYHYDWSGDLSARSGGRLSTFMVYLAAPTAGGGTRFPRIEKPDGASWCEYIECDEPAILASMKEDQEGGVVFKPRKGAAVFWENFDKQGRGYEETWHAGLPVQDGVKIGLNVWSWWQPGYGEAMKRMESEKEARAETTQRSTDGEL